MKRGCKNGIHNVEDQVYFTVIVDEVPHLVRYKIVEKIESIEGFSYVIDALPEQDDPYLSELVQTRRVGTNFRICGDSLFKSAEDARKKAKQYFQDLAARMI
jgi:hypothetical protein